MQVPLIPTMGTFHSLKLIIRGQILRFLNVFFFLPAVCVDSKGCQSISFPHLQGLKPEEGGPPFAQHSCNWIIAFYTVISDRFIFKGFDNILQSAEFLLCFFSFVC